MKISAGHRWHGNQRWRRNQPGINIMASGHGNINNAGENMALCWHPPRVCLSRRKHCWHSPRGKHGAARSAAASRVARRQTAPRRFSAYHRRAYLPLQHHFARLRRWRLASGGALRRHKNKRAAAAWRLNNQYRRKSLSNVAKIPVNIRRHIDNQSPCVMWLFNRK